eukprot:2762256-Prymnesium_polylepis.1
MLLLCVDETDGRTLGAALAGRLVGAAVVNVCDEYGGDTAIGVEQLVSAKGDMAAVERELLQASGCT